MSVTRLCLTKDFWQKTKVRNIWLHESRPGSMLALWTCNLHNHLGIPRFNALQEPCWNYIFFFELEHVYEQGDTLSLLSVSFTYQFCSATWEQNSTESTMYLSVVGLQVQYKFVISKTKGGTDSPREPILFGQNRTHFKCRRK